MVRERVDAMCGPAVKPTSSWSEGVVNDAVALAEKMYPDAPMERVWALMGALSALMFAAQPEQWALLLSNFLTSTVAERGVRERVAIEMLWQQRYSTEEVIDCLLESNGPIFGPLTPLHHKVWTEVEAARVCGWTDSEDLKNLRSFQVTAALCYADAAE
jgi:hypothetical protein